MKIGRLDQTLLLNSSEDVVLQIREVLRFALAIASDTSERFNQASFAFLQASAMSVWNSFIDGRVIDLNITTSFRPLAIR
ncbi:MAG: hypothetical protein FJ122_18075 [Deltaproteobacteria bacterium]|nr:hypothetical protein [Deltaproteobacteria bacterium]